MSTTKKIIMLLLLSSVLFSCSDDSGNENPIVKNKIILTDNPLTISCEEHENLEITIKKGLQFDVLIPEESKAWAKISTTKNQSTDKNILLLKINGNYTKNKRTANIIIKDKLSDTFETLILNQRPIENIEFPEGNILIAKSIESIISIDFYSTFEFDVSIPQNKWLSLAPTQRATPNSKVSFKVTKNTEERSRYLPVTIKSKTSGVFQTIYVLQEGTKKGIYTANDLIDFVQVMSKNNQEKIISCKALYDYGTYDSQTKKFTIEQKSNINLNPNATFSSDGSVSGTISFNDSPFKIDNYSCCFNNIIYNGNNFSIKGYYADAYWKKNEHEAYSIGLFKSISESEIKNVKIESGLIRVRGYRNNFIASTAIGPLAALIDNTSVINCHTNVYIDIDCEEDDEAQLVGGIIGNYQSVALIKDCSSTSSIKMKNLKRSSLGGIVGGYDGWRIWGQITIDNCVARNATITSIVSDRPQSFDNNYNYLGGIIGLLTNSSTTQSTQVIKNCKVEGLKLKGSKKDLVGGICGEIKTPISIDYDQIRLNILDCSITNNTFEKGVINEIIAQPERINIKNVTKKNNTIIK